MTAYRRDWLTEMGAIQREMERLLDHYAVAKPPMVQFAKPAWEPAMDVYETSEAVMVVVDLAGVNEEELEVTYNRKTLVIQGRRKKPGTGTQRSYHLMEIPDGPFSRTIPLPVTVEPERARASYRAGMLEIVVPKSRKETADRPQIIVIRKGEKG